jgi:hypothetical protein
VRAQFTAAGFAEIVAARDLAGVPRVVAGRLAAEERPRDALASTAIGSSFG